MLEEVVRNAQVVNVAKFYYFFTVFIDVAFCAFSYLGFLR